MKKSGRPAYRPFTAVLLAMILCLLGGVALADKTYQNSAADCFDFFASKITFEEDRIVVEGYFYNFTLNREIHSISNLTMEIYDADDQVICRGTFDSLSESLQALRLTPGYASRQVFEFNDTKRNPSDFNMESFSVGILCDFTPSGY